jgi:hypothetical protein
VLGISVSKKCGRAKEKRTKDYAERLVPVRFYGTLLMEETDLAEADVRIFV